jgi:hypothetical protein
MPSREYALAAVHLGRYFHSYGRHALGDNRTRSQGLSNKFARGVAPKHLGRFRETKLFGKQGNIGIHSVGPELGTRSPKLRQGDTPGFYVSAVSIDLGCDPATVVDARAVGLVEEPTHPEPVPAFRKPMRAALWLVGQPGWPVDSVAFTAGAVRDVVMKPGHAWID